MKLAPQKGPELAQRLSLRGPLCAGEAFFFSRAAAPVRCNHGSRCRPGSLCCWPTAKLFGTLSTSTHLNPSSDSDVVWSKFRSYHAADSALWRCVGLELRVRGHGHHLCVHKLCTHVYTKCVFVYTFCVHILCTHFVYTF